jgi:hypothetical protein
MAIATSTCDWAGCQIVARFHIEVPHQSNRKLSGQSSVRLPFSRAHYNVCAAHLDEYSTKNAPAAIYHVGKCPHCPAA